MSRMVANQCIRVVIVEDYRLIRLGIRCDLERHDGFEVLGDFEDAECAMPFIEQHRPDVVILDLGLPGISGIEATLKIKAIDPNIKILILTSHHADQEVIAAFSAAANAYCMKNIDPPRFIEVLRMVADGAAWLDPDIAKIAVSVFYQARSSSLCDSQSQQVAKLTPREAEILKLMVLGKSNSQIAAEIHLSVHTVKSYISSIFQKMEVSDRVQASVKAIQSGFLNG